MALPRKSGAQVVKTLYRIGLAVKRQNSRHVIFHNNQCRHFNVPLHRELKRGTLMGIIKHAGLTKQEFVDNDP